MSSVLPPESKNSSSVEDIEVGMKLEITDRANPDAFRVATVIDIVGRKVIVVSAYFRCDYVLSTVYVSELCECKLLGCRVGSGVGKTPGKTRAKPLIRDWAKPWFCPVLMWAKPIYVNYENLFINNSLQSYSINTVIMMNWRLMIRTYFAVNAISTNVL